MTYEMGCADYVTNFLPQTVDSGFGPLQCELRFLAFLSAHSNAKERDVLIEVRTAFLRFQLDYERRSD